MQNINAKYQCKISMQNINAKYKVSSNLDFVQFNFISSLCSHLLKLILIDSEILRNVCLNQWEFLLHYDNNENSF